MSPLEGRVLHIVYMFMHLSCMYQVENRWIIKMVRERLIVKMKLRASEVK
jgi:hypothetical protein